MTNSAPPWIFAPARRRAMRRRMLSLQQRADAPRYLIDDMVEDVIERLAFLRVVPGSALVVGDRSGTLAGQLAANGATVTVSEPAHGFDEELPWPFGGFDLIISLGTLDTVNDLPGALVHARAALAPGGLFMASFPGAGCLTRLRAAMFAADGDRPAPRLHPMVDVRAGGQLLQRAGFADPVADSRSLDVSFRAFETLIADLRAQGLSNVLASPGPPLGRASLERARQTFLADGRSAPVVERFEILTLSGWKR